MRLRRVVTEMVAKGGLTTQSLIASVFDEARPACGIISSAEGARSVQPLALRGWTELANAPPPRGARPGKLSPGCGPRCQLTVKPSARQPPTRSMGSKIGQRWSVACQDPHRRNGRRSARDCTLPTYQVEGLEIDCRRECPQHWSKFGLASKPSKKSFIIGNSGETRGESNHRHRDFQSRALPTELPGRRVGPDGPLSKARALWRDKSTLSRTPLYAYGLTPMEQRKRSFSATPSRASKTRAAALRWRSNPAASIGVKP